MNLPGGVEHTGRNDIDNRRFINAVFWILRPGEPLLDFPKEYCDWENKQRRFWGLLTAYRIKKLPIKQQKQRVRR